MNKREPDFENNLLRVLKGQKPERATLFELLFDAEYYPMLAGHKQQGDDAMSVLRLRVDAMSAAGYDYVSTHASDMRFRKKTAHKLMTKSLNSDSEINDWESFEKFVWPDPDAQDYSRLEQIAPYLPDGMKLMIMGWDGVLENVMSLVGYDNLCIMMFEEPELVQAIFDQVGSRLLRYYEKALSYDTVGFIICNDDWGFNTQTFLSPADMRKYVFPWHKKIVEAAHKQGKPCILHSCGRYDKVIDDVINDMKYDARHSYEDNIVPVEQAYEDLNGKIAVLGGIDLNYLATKTPQEVYARCRAMLERTADRGGYALGSGNSMANFVPYENFQAMQRAALEFDK